MSHQRFEHSYLGTFARDPLYELAEQLWVEYHYKTETYDRMVCRGVSELTGEAMPTTYIERKLIDENEAQWRNKMLYLKRIHKIPTETFQQAKVKTSRYTHKGIEELYHRYEEKHL